MKKSKYKEYSFKEQKNRSQVENYKHFGLCHIIKLIAYLLTNYELN